MAKPIRMESAFNGQDFCAIGLSVGITQTLVKEGKLTGAHIGMGDKKFAELCVALDRVEKQLDFMADHIKHELEKGEDDSEDNAPARH